MAEALQVHYPLAFNIQLFIIPQDASPSSFFPNNQISLLSTMAFLLVVYFGRNEDKGGCT